MAIISYWIFPIISCAVWLGTLLGLLIHWTVNTHYKHYSSMEADQHIAYISDVGAAELKPLFVAGAILTTLFLDLSFGSDRLLRHKGRLVPNTTTGEKVLSALTIVFAVIGTFGLCLLSGFDTAHYPKLHDIFLLLFIAGYLLSAIFICWEYQRLGKKYRQHRVLRISFWVKLTFVLVELALAIAFAAANFKGAYDVAAVLEWTIAFIFSFYILSFVIDLLPAVHTRHGRSHSLRPMNTMQVEEQNRLAADPRATHDSDRTLTNGFGTTTGNKKNRPTHAAF
ncbi:hypothetical protein GGR56DRAFT_101695 [Xylariaceae sp. FL0804]|nr:hypothetical protein GGR56DRAFT_101695 [Xylariaceae sp. FL0804]